MFGQDYDIHTKKCQCLWHRNLSAPSTGRLSHNIDTLHPLFFSFLLLSPTLLRAIRIVQTKQKNTYFFPDPATEIDFTYISKVMFSWLLTGSKYVYLHHIHLWNTTHLCSTICHRIIAFDLSSLQHILLHIASYKYKHRAPSMLVIYFKTMNSLPWQ